MKQTPGSRTYDYPEAMAWFARLVESIFTNFASILRQCWTMDIENNVRQCQTTRCTKNRLRRAALIIIFFDVNKMGVAVEMQKVSLSRFASFFNIVVNTKIKLDVFDSSGLMSTKLLLQLQCNGSHCQCLDVATCWSMSSKLGLIL